MTVEQTVDWSNPASLTALNRIHAQAMWSLRRTAPLAVLIVLGLFEWLSLHSFSLLIAAGFVALVILAGTRRFNAQLRRAALASGMSTYRLDDALHIQNSLGTLKIPLTLIDLVRSYPAGLIVQYAGGSFLTLPDGPLCRELKHRVNTCSQSSP